MFLDSVVRRISEFVTSSGAHPAVAIDAHASLARSLTNKMVIAADPSGALARLAVLTPPESAPAANASAALGYVRTRPVQGGFDALAVPAWAHGMAVAKTAGPFFDEHGIASWIDTMLPAAKQIA
ncbi:MAG: hypothetical protein JWN27_3243, partial [Candidatus Eremiobacteraeota bacterium]|nr:hypothetical protein [Candidatus Eremiobacteraeota bacterium]